MAPAVDTKDAAAWRQRAEVWASWDPNLATRSDMLGLVDDTEALKTLLGNRLAFGTSGLRGPMGRWVRGW